MPVGRQHRLAITAVLALAAAASCAPADDGTPSPSSVPSEDPPSASRSVEPDRSPEPAAVADVLRFTAPRLGGGTVVGEDLAGDDVAFWFWAPW